ncbi:hypothetical protein ACN6LI_002941, partial [Streptomyces violaceoruber]
MIAHRSLSVGGPTFDGMARHGVRRGGEPGRGGDVGTAVRGPGGEGGRGCAEEGTAGPSAPAATSDPEAARRRAERRAERVTAGATELEQRLAD